MEDLKLGGYVRVSTQQQEDGTSPETQDERIREFGKDLGATLIEDFFECETWSGDDLDRPKLNRIRSGVAEGEIDGFIVYDADRLSRHPVHLLFLKHEIREAGGTIYSVMNDLGDDSDVGDLIAHVKGLAARTERRQIAERSMRGKDKVARSGRMPCGTGWGLFGYDLNEDKSKRVINEPEAVVVRQMFQWAYEGVNRFQIAKRLNEAGLVSKRKKPWTIDSVSRTLRNEAYTGLQWYRKQRHRSVKGGRVERTDIPREDWVEIPDFTPPLISREIYDRVKERMAETHARYQSRAPKRPYLLTGFVRCHSCGTRLIGASLQRGYRYYRCRAAHSSDHTLPSCGERYIRADALEGIVWKALVRNIMEPNTLIEELEHHLSTGEGDLGDKMAELRREIDDLKVQQRRLIELRQFDQIDIDILQERMAPLNALRSEKEAALIVLEEQLSRQDDAKEARRRLDGYCRELAKTIEGLDVDGQRATLAAMGVAVTANREQISMAVDVAPVVTTNSRTWASPRVRTGRSRLAGTRRGSRNS